MLAYQRWQVAKVMRDLKPRTVEEIRELVGFDPGPCLLDERRGAKNFARQGGRWRLTPFALEVMERHESTPRKPWRPARTKPRKKAAREKKRIRIL